MSIPCGIFVAVETGSAVEFHPLQIDVIHALWNLYHASDTTEHLQPRWNKRSRQDTPYIFPIGTQTLKTLIIGDWEESIKETAYGFKEPY